MAGEEEVMSVLEIEKIDAIGVSEDGKDLVLLISDHLNWKNEIEHLILLQEKINSYLGFMEMKQYLEIYPDNVFEHYCINISFKYKITRKCAEFLKNINKQLREYNIQVIQYDN